MLVTKMASSSSPSRRSTYSVMSGHSAVTVIPDASNREAVSLVG